MSRSRRHPLLANVYLHGVLGRGFEEVVKPRLRGRAFMVRYADDLVVVCALEEDVCRVLEVLPKRLGKYGLTVHPEKTRLVPFERPPSLGRLGAPGDRIGPGTFHFVGFTHDWGPSERGSGVVERKTAEDRFVRSLRAASDGCRNNRHLPVAVQHRTLGRKRVGHYRYFGVRGNYRSLDRFHLQVHRAWFRRLRRRSQRTNLTWPRFQALLLLFPLPMPRITAT